MRTLTSLIAIILCTLSTTNAFAQPAFIQHDICVSTMGTYSSTPDNFTEFNSKLFFRAYDTLGFNPQYTSAATVAPSRLYNFNASASGKCFKETVVHNNLLVFTAYNYSGEELWATDGTPGNTYMINDINPAFNSAHPFDLTLHDTSVYFIATSKNFKSLYKTNGQLYNTQLIYTASASPNSGAVSEIVGSAGGKLIFQAWNTTHGFELFATDGTTAGTYMLKDINPGYNRLPHTDFIAYKNKIYFTAQDATHGKEVWVTDGTSAGTNLFLDIFPGIDNSEMKDPIVMDSILYFSAYEGVNSYEVWRTDGTVASTRMIRNINKNTSSVNANTVYTIFNHKLYFLADDGIHGLELWRTDGTDTGTVMVRDIVDGAPGSGVYAPMFVGGQYLYFIANDSSNGTELWRTDGTRSGTTLVKDINAGKDNSNPIRFINFKNKVIFSAETLSGVRDLYVTDGTPGGTGKLIPFPGNNTNPLDTLWFKGFALYNNAVYFCANYDAGKGKELWVLTDPTLPPTQVQSTPLSQAYITLYPNPAHHNFTIKTTTAFKAGSITLTDITGRVVMTEKLYNNEQAISLQGIAPGIYMADVWLDDKRSTQKIVVE